MEQFAEIGGAHGLRVSPVPGIFKKDFATQPVAIEMNRVERLASCFRLAQPTGELFEGGRTYDFQMKRLTRRTAQSAKQAPRHRTEWHAIVFQSADREENADFAGGRAGENRAAGGSRMAAYKGRDIEVRIGSGSVFMDRSGIVAGDVWPERLRESIERATVVFRWEHRGSAHRLRLAYLRPRGLGSHAFLSVFIGG